MSDDPEENREPGFKPGVPDANNLHLVASVRPDQLPVPAPPDWRSEETKLGLFSAKAVAKTEHDMPAAVAKMFAALTGATLAFNVAVKLHGGNFTAGVTVPVMDMPTLIFLGAAFAFATVVLQWKNIFGKLSSLKTLQQITRDPNATPAQRFEATAALGEFVNS